MGQAPDLSLFTRMALLFPGLSGLPFFKLSYNQQVSLESFQAIVIELELQLLLPGRASLTISYLLCVRAPVETILSVAGRLA